jgi:hypothetical protein
MSGSFHACREELGTVSLQSYLGQRSRWRALQDRAVPDGKESLVAGAFEAVILRGIIDGTGKMRAFLAVGDVFVFASTHHDAMILRCRRREYLNITLDE